MPLRTSLPFILLVFFSVQLAGQNTSIAQFANSKTSGIHWFYSNQIAGVNVQDEIKASADISRIEEILNKANLSIIRYTPAQYIIVRSDQMHTSIKEWRDIKQADRELINATNNATAATRMIGSKGAPLHQGLASIKGIVRESSSGKPAVGATVQVLQTQKGAVTDVNGAYELQLKPGPYVIRINSLGMSAEEIPVILQGDGNLNVKLEEDATRLGEVVVTEKAVDHNVTSLITGIEQLTTKEIKKLPSFMGEVDVLKSLITLPGVSTVGEGVGGVNVRGSTPDYNLIIEDDIMFFNPTHALGFFSLFNPDITEDIKLYKGYIPAKYGGRISSVIQTTSRAVNKENWNAKLGLGLLSSRAFVELPLDKGKTAIMVGGRISHANWFLKQINVPDVQKSKVAFADLEIKLDHSLSPTSNIGVQVYKGYDDLTFSDLAKFNYGNEAYSIYHKKVFGTKVNLITRAVLGGYNSELGDLLKFNPSLFKTSIGYKKLKSDLTWQKTAGSFLNFGVEAIQYTVNPGAFSPDGPNSQAFTRTTSKDHGIEAGIYAGLEQKLSDQLSISGGVRVSTFLAQGPKTINKYKDGSLINDDIVVDSSKYNSGQIIKTFFNIEPRLSVNYRLSPSSSIKLGYNRTAQYLSLISNTVAATPVDFWKLADYYIPPQRANTVSLGYYKNFNQNIWETSIEIYARNIDGVFEYKDFPNLLINNHLETELLPTRARAYGLELSIEKKIGSATGRLGYTYSRSLRQTFSPNKDLNINNGDWYAATYDKPNDVNLLLNFNVSQRINFSTHFVYNTGRPLTAPEANYGVWNLVNIPQYSQRNQYRIPDYFRADAALNVFPSYKKDQKFKGSWALSVYNIFGIRNAYSVYFNQKPFQSILAYRLAILGSIFPSINYNIEFK